MAHGLSCSTACGTFLDQGSNLFSPALAGGFLTTEPPGKSQVSPFSILRNFVGISHQAGLGRANGVTSFVSFSIMKGPDFIKSFKILHLVRQFYFKTSFHTLVL